MPKRRSGFTLAVQAETAPYPRSQSGFAPSCPPRGDPPYSGTVSPEPPNSAGKSFSFGSPSFMRRTVSP